MEEAFRGDADTDSVEITAETGSFSSGVSGWKLGTLFAVCVISKTLVIRSGRLTACRSGWLRLH